MPALIALICFDPPTSILLRNSCRAPLSVTVLPASISPDTKARALRHLKPWIPECTHAFPESRLRLSFINHMSTGVASPKAASSHSEHEPHVLPTRSTGEDVQGIFVDAATSWGAGLVINGYWMSWRFRDEWQLAERNNNVAETIAFELAIHYLIAHGTSDARVLIHCDSISVITAFNSGRSPNEEQARAVERIYGLRDVYHLDVQMQHVAGKKNPADAPSRGILLPAPRLPGSLAIPPSLSPFVESV
ncbi:hypothetical protein A0H81_02799 [Grifola frondosa]|uniref:Uncharacterized protein n=1 Tax=Grifola frondosa TaxID=5627 RepID=A0A1C7MNC0_GRIFR|nr:hypothetical protein A0H81_02799 [Grifola frondosa]